MHSFVGIHNPPTAKIWRNHWYSKTVLYFVMHKSIQLNSKPIPTTTRFRLDWESVYIIWPLTAVLYIIMHCTGPKELPPSHWSWYKINILTTQQIYLTINIQQGIATLVLCNYVLYWVNSKIKRVYIDRPLIHSVGPKNSLWDCIVAP